MQWYGITSMTISKKQTNFIYCICWTFFVCLYIVKSAENSEKLVTTVISEDGFKPWNWWRLLKARESEERKVQEWKPLRHEHLRVGNQACLYCPNHLLIHPPMKNHWVPTFCSALHLVLGTQRWLLGQFLSWEALSMEKITVYLFR